MARYRKIKIDDVVDHIEKNRRQDVSFGQVIDLAQSMAKVLDQAIARHDQALHAEFTTIAREIAAMKSDVAALRPADMRFERLPEAGLELDEVLKATEVATNTIMAAAETIMAADCVEPDAYKALVDEKMIEIFEACSFQDITGQRLSKVVRTLEHVEERIVAIAERLKVTDAELPPLAETAEEKRRRELILHGPQREGEGVRQDEVDQIIASQDEIDALFG